MARGSNTSGSQRDTRKRISPPWLASGVAEKFLYPMGLALDVLLDKLGQAVQLRMPGRGDPSQLPLLAADRLLVQGSGESNTAFVARLKGAFDAWQKAGSRGGILGQLQAYFNFPASSGTPILPALAIVGDNANSTTWSLLSNAAPSGATPDSVIITPSNWNWDGSHKSWRNWLILFCSLTATNLSGSAAVFTSLGTTIALAATGGNFPNLIQTAVAHGYATGDVIAINNTLPTSTNGAWPVTVLSSTTFTIPQSGNSVATSSLGTATSRIGFVTVDGLSGLTSANVGQWLVVSGAAFAGNNGAFPIAAVNSTTQAVIACPNAVLPDPHNGALSWTIKYYPVFGPGLPWGTSGTNWGDSTRSWGLNAPSPKIAAIRAILARWKSAGTYYVKIILAFDGGDGSSAYQFSPYGSALPDGTWSTSAKTVAGVVVSSRVTQSPYDIFCDGTGKYVQCSVHNVT